MQFVLDLPAAPPRMTRADFVVGAPNEHALAMIDAWKRSAEPLLVICGPAGSGKTHLLHVLAGEARAMNFDAILVDDVDSIGEAHELLGLVEDARADRRRLVLAGRGEPGDWARGLPDLSTRLNAAARIALAEPDEALLRAVMAKLFKDRQLRASGAIADAAAARLPKTFTAAQAFVSALDAASIEKGRPISVKLAREVAANLSEEAASA